MVAAAEAGEGAQKRARDSSGDKGTKRAADMSNNEQRPSYAAATSKLPTSDPFAPKQVVSRAQVPLSKKPCRQFITETAAFLTVDYMKHIWKFITKHQGVDVKVFYRLTGFIP